MDLTFERIAVPIIETLRGDDARVVAHGSGTHAATANPVEFGCEEIRVPSGIVRHDPADMTVTVLAGTTCRELADVLGEHGQEVPLDPADDRATIGGVLACGLSGTRRLRLGPVRDAVLEVRVVDGNATLIKGGGPVVKNVTGYDIPRLMVGSFGTLGVIVQATLRCRPKAPSQRWYRTERDPFAVRQAMFKPTSILWNGHETSVLIEGFEQDCDDEAARGNLTEAAGNGSAWIFDARSRSHRGRISVRPTDVRATMSRLAMDSSVHCVAEVGVGTIHVSSDDVEALVRARAAAVAESGWLLRESGGPLGFDGFGDGVANSGLAGRVKSAFDPHGKLAPGRMPL